MKMIILSGSYQRLFQIQRHCEDDPNICNKLVVIPRQPYPINEVNYLKKEIPLFYRRFEGGLMSYTVAADRIDLELSAEALSLTLCYMNRNMTDKDIIDD
jgi:hypothetical protein